MDDFEDEQRKPGDYCDGCKEYVASDGACYCDEDEDDHA
jgi:hypothetical protein